MPAKAMLTAITSITTCCTGTNSTKKGEENFMKLHPITDAEFYEMQRQIIEYCFKPKPKENV